MTQGLLVATAASITVALAMGVAVAQYTKLECTFARSDKNVVTFSCSDGVGGTLSLLPDRVLLAQKTAKGQIAHADAFILGPDIKSGFSSLDLRRSCLRPKEQCECLLPELPPGLDESGFCGLPLCEGPGQLPSGCTEAVPASMDFCAILNGGCDDVAVRAAGFSSYFCAAAILC